MSFISTLTQKISGLFSDPREAELESICHAIRHQTKGLIMWEKDDRFRAVCSTPMPATDLIFLREILERYFPVHVTMNNIDRAPRGFERIIAELGAIEGVNELYSVDPTRDILLYAAVWPWSDAQTVSVRIGFVTLNIFPTQEKKIFRKFCDWFGVILLD